MVDSNQEFIFHSNVSIDSLINNTDDYFIDDDISHPKTTRNNNAESLNEVRNLNKKESHKEENDNKVKLYNVTESTIISDSLENVETEDLSDGDINGNQAKEMSTKQSNVPTDAVDDSKRKREMPKSQTFDTPRSIYHSRCVSDADDQMIGMSSSNSTSTTKSGNGSEGRNHVFLTSQECVVIPGSSKLPRDTIASRLRMERRQSKEGPTHSGNMYHGNMYHCTPETFQDGPYQTPLQRKEVLIRDLKRQIRDLKHLCDEKDHEIGVYRKDIDEKTSKVNT